MDERELEASNRRMWLILGGGLALLALGLLVSFLLGKGFDAPLGDYDSEGVARAVGEEMKQVGDTATIAAGKTAAAG